MTGAKPFIPERVKKFLPEEVVKAFNNDLRKPIAKGTSSSLADDNVLDFVYYGQEKKIFWKKNGFYQKLGLDGSPTPLQCMRNEKKYKCLAYMILHNINDSNELVYLDYLTKYDPPAPYWFQLLSFSMAHFRKIYFDIGKLDSFIYYLLFNAPKDENDQPNVYPFLVEFDKFLTKLETRDCIILYRKTPYFQRENANEESDIEFYRSCSKINQDWLKKFTFQVKAFDLRIEKIIEEECDLNMLFNTFLPYQFCEYIVKKKKYTEFYAWIN